MFVRIKKRNNTDKKAVQIVQSFREGSKVRQKVIQTIGYAFDQDTINKLVDVAEHLKERLLQEQQPKIFPPEVVAKQIIDAKNDIKQKQEDLSIKLNNLLEDNRYISGFSDVYSKIYDIFGYNALFTKRFFSSSKVFFQIVLARLSKPLSKRGSVNFIHDNFGHSDINLDKIYRMMDSIDDKFINKLQLQTFNSVNKLFKGKIKIAFYDCTTLYFESFISDDLKNNGYSKDGKFNQTQVLLALLVTDECLPLGYELFPGNTFEGNTLELAMNRLKVKYGIEDIIIVADSGLMSKENLEKLENLGYSYVLGARLRTMKKLDQENILNNMSKFEEYSDKEKLFETNQERNRLIVKYSKKRAKKDENDRNIAINKLKKKLEKSKNPMSLISNYGYKIGRAHV